MTRRLRMLDRLGLHWLPTCSALMLAGCSLAPVYQTPAVPIPAAYKETSGLWQPAKPGDRIERGEWWKVYGDKTLDSLQARLDQANPTLAVALARYDIARGYAGEASADLSPHAGFSASPTRNRQSDNRPLRGSGQPADYDADTAQFTFDYELDFWGRVRNEVASGKSQAEAAGDDLATARLSLHADLANLYIQLIGSDIQAGTLNNAIDAYRKALALTENRFDGGVDSQLPVSRAKTQLSDALAQAAEVSAQRALVEHAIASLIGEAASSFSLPTTTTALALPAIPTAVPSVLLQRRPDIAAAERRAFAANAEIGVARAAFYPSFSLSGLFGWQNTANGSLLSAGNRIWTLGPLAAVNLFDGGKRRAKEQEAKAGFEVASGQYRSTVLSAFQQVEDNLSLLANLSREAKNEDDAASSAQDSERIATNRYREGAVNYLDVVTAQTSYLQARRAVEQLRTRRLQASVNLIKALGGGWQTPLPTS